MRRILIGRSAHFIPDDKNFDGKKTDNKKTDIWEIQWRGRGKKRERVIRTLRKIWRKVFAGLF